MPEPDTRTREELLDEVKELSARLQTMERAAADRQQTEERLRHSERQSRAWLEHSPVCTKIVDLDFNLQYMSSAGVRELQIDDINSFYGKPYPFDFYPQSFREAMQDRLQTARETGTVTTLEASVVDINNNELWYHSTLVPVSNDDGQIEYIIVVSLEITERKQAEEQRMLLERQVQHAQKLESLGVLSGGIAHDFNNILTSILGNADLAMHLLPEDSPARVNLQEVENASRRAADLAQQMLAYSGQGRFVTESIDLGEFVQEMVHLLQVSISRQVELTCDFAEDAPTFDGDATQIRQVIMNLITNASDAIGDHPGTIEVSTGVTHYEAIDLNEFRGALLSIPGEARVPGLYSWLEVKDSGCGMDEDTVHRIFDPFFTTKVSGRGLGMSAVQGIVRGHGGAISVCSRPGQGTRFRVLFPANGDARDSGRVRAAESAATDAWRGTGTVLIVDDEAPVCEVGRMMLERLGFDVLTAFDGSQAVDMLRRHRDRIVCILLDLTMPNSSGEAVYRELHQVCSSTPIILCSGYTLLDDDQRFSESEPARFIQKPYTLATLQGTLQDVLETSDSRH